MTGVAATATTPTKFKSSLTFLGEGNYRFNAAFRVALELGLSQLATGAESGNETSFFDVRPEYIRRLGKKFEVYIGPMLGLFFLAQNAEKQTLTGTNDGTEITMKQHTASTLLIGLSLGADYALNSQFDIGLNFRYFKPGTLTVTGTETFPPDGNIYESKLTTSYLTVGTRFAIHF
jgi:opacity protein-like surface antigen